MRRRHLPWLAVLPFALAVGGCGGGPTYEVLKEDGAHVKLLAPDSGKDAAKKAIKSYLDTNTGASSGPKYLDIMVVKSETASTYVCSSRYFQDQQTAATRAGNPTISTSGYPAFTMNCP